MCGGLAQHGAVGTFCDDIINTFPRHSASAAIRGEGFLAYYFIYIAILKLFKNVIKYLY